jgi:hypothetical protein
MHPLDTEAAGEYCAGNRQREAAKIFHRGTRYIAKLLIGIRGNL